MKRAALYLRVSTASQTTDENQRIELERVAAHVAGRSWRFTRTRACLGAKGREQRPAFDRMLKDATQGRLRCSGGVVCDRLGRSLQGFVSFLSDFQATGRDLYLHQQALDTATPSGRALFGMLGVFAEFERSLIKERVRAGLARAKERGVTLGRPRVRKSWSNASGASQ